MADLKITTLPALAEAGIQATDPLAIADVSATETKKVTVKDLIAAGVALIDDGDIPGAKVGTLGTNQVASGAIQANAVTAAKIASGTITATQIADATITGAKLVNDTVTATQIAANAITASELADNAVDTAAIAANAVTTAKITDANVTYAKLSLSDGDIPGAKIATGGITATQLAANSVAASELADDAVDTAAIVDGAVTAVKIATNTITANQIAANAIGASELADNAVDTAAIADGAVTAAKLSGTLSSSSIADNAVTTAKIVDDAVTSAKLAANAVDAAALADNAVDSGAISSNAVIEAKIAANAVTVTKIADGTITPAKLNTSNLDRSLNVASGNLGINNTITAATRSGITYNAQGLITGTVALAAGDLPVATTSAVGGISVGTGLAVTGAGALSLSNSVTGATISGITFNNQGMITAATALVAGDLPVATTSAKGAVQITSGGGLTVDGSGNLITSTSGISAGTYQSITVNNKGVATAGAALTASLIPDLAASKITSGSLDAARIGADTIDGSKLSNSSTAIFQSIAQSGYPTAQFSGQILFDTVSEDAFIWDGNAWQAITTLTKGSLVFGGNFNASTSKMTACSTAGLAAGLAVGSNLPTPSATTDGLYVVVDTAGTPSAPAPVVAFSPPDYILGVTNTTGSSWNEIDLSQTVAGQVASNITFTPYGQLSATNVQDALQELETEKLALTGGTVTGQVLIGNTGSLVFEGSTIDAYETTITVADPTSSDKTITFPDTTGTVITSGDTNTVTSTMVDASLVNTNLAAGAAIAFSKLAALTSAQILVGNGSNVPTAVAVTGDISINNAGLTAIASGVIVDGDISGSAAITGSKITTGTTSAVGVLQLTNSTSSTSATTAATPAAVKTAFDLATTANTNAANAAQTTGTTFTGNVIIDNAKELRLSEADADGAHFTGFKAQAQSADITYTLPATAPTTGQVLKSGSTATTLEWASDSATDATKMPLAGGTFTGDVTFTGDSSNGLWDKSASAFVANLTGNAATATALATARTIGGVSFDGTANINLPGVNASGTQDTSGTAAVATAITIADESSDTTCFPLFATAATGNLGAKSGTNLTFNSNTGALTATSFVGALTGNVTGNASGSAATVTGAAQSAITSVGTLTSLGISGNLTVDTSTLHVDATNNRVLIGRTTTNTGYPLCVEADGGGENILVIGRSADDISEIGFFENDTTTRLGEIQYRQDHVNFRHRVGDIRFATGGSTERMRIDSSGRLLVGVTGSTSLWGINSQLQVEGTDGETSSLSITRNTNNAGGPYLLLAKSRGTSDGSHTIVQSGDRIGTIAFVPADGTNKGHSSAQIAVEIDGTPGVDDLPSRLQFFTTADGANSSTERMRITSTGAVKIGTTIESASAATNLVVHTPLSSSNANSIEITQNTNGANKAAAGIGIAIANGGASTNAADLYFSTATNGSLGERLRIKENGALGIAGANYGTSGQVLTSGGSGAAPSWADAGGGGGTVELVADGAIAANHSVIVTSAGKAKEIAEVVTTNNPPTALTPASLGADTKESDGGVRVGYDPVHDVTFTLWVDGASDLNMASYLWSNAGSTLPTAADGAELEDDHVESWPQIASHPTNGYHIVTWKTGKTNKGRAKMFNFNSSGSPLLGSNQQVSDTTISSPNENVRSAVYDPDTDKFIVGWQTSDVNVLTPNYSNKTLSRGSAVQAFSSSFGSTMQLFYDEYSNKLIVAIWNGTTHYLEAKVGTVSGTSVSFGSTVNIAGDGTASNTGEWMSVSGDPTTGKLLFAWMHNSGSDMYGKCKVASVNGNSFDLGSETTFQGATSGGTTRNRVFYDPNIGKFLIAYRISTTTSQVLTVTISGTTPSFTSALTITGSYNTSLDMVYNPDLKRWCYVYRNGGNGHRNNTTIHAGGVTNNLSTSFIGFSDAAYSDGQTATINVVGNTTTQSSLTAGTKYYINTQGNLQTTADTPSIEAGIALSSTSLLIKG